MKKALVWTIALLLCSCKPSPPTVTRAAATPPPAPTPTPTPAQPLFAAPQSPQLSPAGLDLIYEFETGGRYQYERNPHPEFLNDRGSGVTAGIGWDFSQYSKAVTIHDWSEVLPAPEPQRLAETQPFSGAAARAPWLRVRDILISWAAATHVFLKNDVAREFASARRAYGPDFDALTPNCQAALIANGFARGYSFVGPNRVECRAIRDLVPKRDYPGIAEQLRKQERVWRGTNIYNGLKNRVNGEADLAVKP